MAEHGSSGHIDDYYDNSFNELIDNLRKRLPDYLHMMGAMPNEKGKMLCINPEHDEKTPSMSITYTDEKVYFRCFGCEASGNIFHAAHYLEAKPHSGPDWVEETVYYLADKFNMQYDRRELTETQKQHVHISRLYETVYKTFVEMITFEHTDTRNWSHDICTERGAGTVDWLPFRGKLMEETGLTAKALEEADIKKYLFNTDAITFAVKNEYGRCIGFAARNMKWDKSKPYPKYINTSNNIQTYNKSLTLYGMENAKKYKHLYIFEGYADLLSAYEKGIRNCVAIGGTSLTKYHVDWLESLGVRVTLCLDNDSNKSAQKKTEKFLDEYFSGRQMPISVITVPLDEGQTDTDPDTFLQSKGGDAFKEIPEFTAFEWRSNQFDYTTTGEEMCEKMIPLILSEESSVRRYTMVEVLAKKSGIDKSFIIDDLDAIKDAESMEVKKERNDLIYKLQKNIKHVDDPASVAESFAAEYRSKAKDSKAATLSHRETMDFIGDFQKQTLESKNELPGFETGFEDTFDKLLNGIPKGNRMITIAAEPNVGKSAITVNLAWELAKRNDDVIVLDMTIDDKREFVIAKWVAIESGVGIDHVLYPNRFLHDGVKDYEMKRAAVTRAWQKVKELVADNRLDVKDVEHGSDLNFVETWIQHTQKNHPDKKIVFILDNFHKLTGGPEGLREKFVDASARIHIMKGRYGVTFIQTAETRKPFGNRITLNDLAETKKLEFDSDAVILVHNDMHSNPFSPALYWTDPDKLDGYNKQPILELTVAKNKITSFKGTMHFKFQPDTARLFETTAEQNTPQEETVNVSF